jgi:hypothetical protein
MLVGNFIRVKNVKQSAYKSLTRFGTFDQV